MIESRETYVLFGVGETKTLRPVGFEPTRFGETVGLKSTPLDHSGRSAIGCAFRKKKQG